MSPQISVIIPTFNRAGIIGQTLESLIGQTFVDWECLVVDDRSQDDTDLVVSRFIDKDARFKYFKRPENSPKGANCCRNIGFANSKGDFVMWFDSDDLMRPEKLEVQLDVLLKDDKIDFSVARYANFDEKNTISKEPAFDKNRSRNLDLVHFIDNSVFWGTIDFLCRRDVLKDVVFNEKLQSGQDYNFFVRVLLKRPTGIFIDRELSLRRMHPQSIQNEQSADSLKRLRNKFFIYWFTFDDCRHADSTTRSYLMKNAILFYHKLLLHVKPAIPLRELLETVKNEFGSRKAVAVLPILLFAKIFRKGDIPGSKMIRKIFIA